MAIRFVLLSMIWVFCASGLKAQDQSLIPTRSCQTQVKVISGNAEIKPYNYRPSRVPTVNTHKGSFFLTKDSARVTQIRRQRMLMLNDVSFSLMQLHTQMSRIASAIE